MDNLINIEKFEQSDLENLKKYQQLNIDEFVEGIIHTCKGNAIHGDDIRSPRAAFNIYINDQQKKMNAKCMAVGSKDMYVNLSKINWKFCKNFIDRYDKAPGKRIDPQKIMDEFKKEFKKKYFNILFASNSSTQNSAKNN